MKKKLKKLKTFPKDQGPVKKPSPAAGPSTPKKPRSLDQGIGTVRVPLTDADIAARGLKLARKLNEREIEVAAQASAKKLMSGRLADIDDEIHQLQTAMREKIEEQPAPGLFGDEPPAGPLDDKAIGEDTMARMLDDLDAGKSDEPKDDAPPDESAATTDVDAEAEP